MTENTRFSYTSFEGGDREFCEEFGGALIEHGPVIATCRVTEGTGQPRFSDPCRRCYAG